MTLDGSRRLTVSEASRALGMSRTTLLAAEEAGLLVPARTPGGHRRYDPGELDRFLGRHRPDAGPPDTGPPDTGPSGSAPPGSAPPGSATPAPHVVHLVPAVRAAVRPLAQALDADTAGLYLHGASGLRFCAAFGIPRWLAERLTECAAPPVVEQAFRSRRHRVFDAASVGFPEARSTGHGVAMPLSRDPDAIGVLFLVTHAEHGLLPAELRTVEAFGVLVAAVVADRLRITDLEHRLAQIAALSGLPPCRPSAPSPPHPTGDR